MFAIFMEHPEYSQIYQAGTWRKERGKRPCAREKINQ
jgi:hypothetical protein